MSLVSSEPYSLTQVKLTWNWERSKFWKSCKIVVGNDFLGTICDIRGGFAGFWVGVL